MSVRKEQGVGAGARPLGGGDPLREELLDRLRRFVSAGDDACINGTPMIPLHRDTVAAIVALLDPEPISPPRHICGYPVAGWRLDYVQWDEREGQPNGWIVALKRTGAGWECRSYTVLARSDLGPLEAWDEALAIAAREDAREAEKRARPSDENGEGSTEGQSPKGAPHV